MNFAKHLFISYAHIDNHPLTPEQLGWVSRFHVSLGAMLEMRMGRKAEIWRDEKLAGNDFFADEIVAQFPKTAMLVSVLTPRYVESEWCTRELKEFCKAAEQSGGVRLGNKSRIVKVIKTPVDSEDALPPFVKELLGYEFYTLVDEAPLELDGAYGVEMAQKYNLRLARLGWDIAQLLKQMENATLGGEEVAALATKRHTVYLAECSYDRREARDALDSELRLHGYSVLPERPLPREEVDFVTEVNRLLQQSDLSIHLVGSGGGGVPDGPSQKPVVMLQNELAIQRSKNGKLRRLIWIPEGTTSVNSDQQRFIDTLHKDAEAQFAAELITADLETVKRSIHAALQKLEQPEASKLEAANSTGATKLVYLVCDQRDRPLTIPLRKYLKGQGIDVLIPVFEGDAATVRQSNQDALTQCDAVILFYGAGDEAWKRTVENDVRKIRGSRTQRPLPATYTYLAEPVTADKKELQDLEETNLIVGLEGFSEETLQPFLAMLRQA